MSCTESPPVFLPNIDKNYHVKAQSEEILYPISMSDIREVCLPDGQLFEFISISLFILMIHQGRTIIKWGFKSMFIKIST